MEQEQVAPPELETTSQEQKQETPEEITPEVTAIIERRAQSEADKRSRVFEEKLRDQQAEVTRLRAELENQKTVNDQRERETVDTVLNKYVANGELPETSLPPIKDYIKGILDRDKAARDKEAKATETLKKAEEKEREVAELKATRAVLKVARELGVSLPEDEAEEIAKKTEGNLSWASDIIRAKAIPPPLPEKNKPRRPDSSAPTAPGGKLTNQELQVQYISGKISTEAYEKECKLRGISPG